MKSGQTLDAYIASFPPATQTILKKIRDIALKAAPGSEGVVSYGVAAIKRGGTYVVYFGGYPKHVSVYPVYANDPVLGKAIAAYSSGKATAKFPLDKPVPYALITKIVKEKVKEHAARVEAKAAKIRKPAKKIAKKGAKKAKGTSSVKVFQDMPNLAWALLEEAKPLKSAKPKKAAKKAAKKVLKKKAAKK
ncbi:MAG: hypothetical protein K0Q91_1168 [Fibrobacteria bacterium]|jgi:uncharacterized protein YdhG (YjbR/CyaY superfamily)|nr:hypothetical protein [Fibrobacteria bacterium]